MSKGTGASASWWCCQGTLGNSREGTEREGANSGDRFLQAMLGILGFTLSPIHRPFCDSKGKTREPSLCAL